MRAQGCETIKQQLRKAIKRHAPDLDFRLLVRDREAGVCMWRSLRKRHRVDNVVLDIGHVDPFLHLPFSILLCFSLC